MPSPPRFCNLLYRRLLPSPFPRESGLALVMLLLSLLPVTSIAAVAAGGSYSFLEEMPNKTVLFYHWEPDGMFGPGSEFTRLVFEDPVLCDYGNIRLFTRARPHEFAYQVHRHGHCMGMHAHLHICVCIGHLYARYLHSITT